MSDPVNPLEAAHLLRRVLKQEWVIDARIVVEVDDEQAWRDLLAVSEIVDRSRFLPGFLSQSMALTEVVVDGVTFRLARRPH